MRATKALNEMAAGFKVWTRAARAGYHRRTMYIDLQTLVTALGLALVLEGLPYFIWAEKMPKVLLLMASRPAKVLRMLGLTAMLGGLLLVFIARS